MTETSQKPTPKRGFMRFIPLLVVVAALALFFATGLNQYISLDVLRDNRVALQAWVAGNWLGAALGFMAAYALLVAISFPGASLLTLLGGFLFGVVWGSLFVVVGATAGATAIFLIARSALGDVFRNAAGGFIARMEEGLKENEFSYLLILRLVPLFPFWAVNLAPAFVGVSLFTYVTATFIGIIPGAVVYASVGNGLGEIFEQGGEPDLGIIFRWEILLPILGLALLSLIPVLYKRLSAKRSG